MEFIQEKVYAYYDGDESVKRKGWKQCKNAISKKILSLKKTHGVVDD